MEIEHIMSTFHLPIIAQGSAPREHLSAEQLYSYTQAE